MGPQKGSCVKTKKMKGYQCFCKPTMKKGLWLNKGRHRNAQDIFKVTTKPGYVTVKRVDKAGRNCHGWGMNLMFSCKCSKYRPFKPFKPHVHLKPKCHKKCGVHKKCRKHYIRIPGKVYKRCFWRYMKPRYMKKGGKSMKKGGKSKGKKKLASLAQALPPRPMKIVMGPQKKSCTKAKKMKGYKCYCPSTMKKGKWLNNGRHKHAQDIFKVTTKGQGVQVKRVDKAGRNCHGWGMNLTFMCKCRRLPKRRKIRRTRHICRKYYKWVRAKKHKVRCIHKKVVRCKWHKTKKMKFQWRSVRRCYKVFWKKFCRKHRVPSWRHVYARKCHHGKRKVCYKYKPMRRIISVKCYKLLLKCKYIKHKPQLKVFHKCHKFRACRVMCTHVKKPTPKLYKRV